MVIQPKVDIAAQMELHSVIILRFIADEFKVFSGVPILGICGTTENTYLINKDFALVVPRIAKCV